jgi:hypothetical protein
LVCFSRNPASLNLIVKQRHFDRPMAKTTRKAQIFGLIILFIFSVTGLAIGIPSLETKGVAFISCRTSGCRTNLALTVGCGITALVSALGLLGACLRRRDDDKAYGD